MRCCYRQFCGVFNTRMTMRMILMLWVVIFITPACAADYKIDYAIKSDHGEEVGIVGDCEFNRICVVETKNLNYRLSVEVFKRNTQLAYVHLNRGVDCCFFSGAVTGLSLQVGRNNLESIPFFKGRPAKGAEFIQNKKVGELYLHLSFLNN